MDKVKWQLLNQYLEAMSLLNGEFEDSILLASQLVRELESELISMKISSGQLRQEEIFSLHQEVSQLEEVN